jgi:hypothetical protein
MVQFSPSMVFNTDLTWSSGGSINPQIHPQGNFARDNRARGALSNGRYVHSESAVYPT